MAEILTNRGAQLLAQHQGNGTHLNVNKFILALVPGQDSAAAIDPNRGLPPAGQIVHEQLISDGHKGYLAPDMVSYSLFMGENVGPFTFNTIYAIATDESNAVIQIITLPDTPKIATDDGEGIRGQAMVRNAVLVYDNAQTITNVTVEADAWQFDWERATTEKYGLTKEATPEQTKAGLLKGIFVSPFSLYEWWKEEKKKVGHIVGNQLYFLGKEDPRFFILDGSTIPNGVIDYPQLASSGSPFITINGNNIVLMDIPDVVRGKGSSSRNPGDFQNDQIKSHSHEISFDLSYKTPGANVIGAGDGSPLNGTAYTSSVGGDENRVRSRTSLIGIYHGEL